MNRFFLSISKNSNYKVVNYGSAIWSLGDQLGDIHYHPEPFFEDHYDILFRRKGHIYVPHRKPFDFPGRATFKHIFFLRDPRDVLVSAFYSFGFTHARPENISNMTRYDEFRNRIRMLGIDGYALEASIDWLIPLYDTYKEFRESTEKSIFLTYDEFKNNRIKFIHTILNFLDVNMSNSDINLLEESMSPDKGKDGKHIRSGESNQFHNELNTDTREILDERFTEILNYWGFEN